MRMQMRASALVCFLLVVVVNIEGTLASFSPTCEARSEISPRGVERVSAGTEHSCALFVDASVRCWGSNDNGQLGQGHTVSTIGAAPFEMGNHLLPVNLGVGRNAISIKVGNKHSCALLQGGEVKCWGDNSAGQLGQGDIIDRGDTFGNMGDNLKTVELGTGLKATKIAVGNEHSCALLDDATVKCWGSNDFGQLGQGRTGNRGMYSFEMSDFLPRVDLGAGRTAVEIQAGGYHTCAILDNGNVKCWGHNSNGQLGQSTKNHLGDAPNEMGDFLLPVELGTNRTAVLIELGVWHTCAILDDATTKCWGYNGHGQLGLGDRTTRGDGPISMGDNLPAVDFGQGMRALHLAAGDKHTCALLNDSSVKCFGNGNEGQLGLGPALIALGDDSGEMGLNLPSISHLGMTVSSISACSHHTCAVLHDSTAKCWGFNHRGQLGVGSVANVGRGKVPDPISLGAGRTALKVAAGNLFTCAILDNNYVKCWGHGGYGKLATGSTVHVGDNANEMGDFLPPIDIGFSRTAVSLALGFYHACVILDNGNAKCWGHNNHGMLGIDKAYSGNDQNIGDQPGEMTVLSEVHFGKPAIQIVAGGLHTCVLLDDASVKCWGYNGYGQLGCGDTINRGDNVRKVDSLNPVALGSGRTATSISAGEHHTCAVLDDASVKCWGYNGYGQLGLGHTINIGTAASHMGDNLLPVNLGAGRSAVSISLGSYHTCALLDDSTVKCWGRSHIGQTGSGGTGNLGDTLSTVGDGIPRVDLGDGRSAVSIEASFYSTCAVLDDATLKCWGRNDQGQLGLGDKAHRGDALNEMGDELPAIYLGEGRAAIQVSVGEQQMCVLRDDSSVVCFGRNYYGELGQGNTAASGDSPTFISTADLMLSTCPVGEWGRPSEVRSDVVPLGCSTNARVVKISSGGYHVCALLDTGDLKCWGYNAHGQLGLGDTFNRGDDANEMGFWLDPIDIGDGLSIVGMAAAETFTCALVNDTTITVKCFGHNAQGQLGQGHGGDRGSSKADMGSNLVPVSLGANRRAISIAGFFFHMCVVLDNGSVKCWGRGANGQLGQGETANRGFFPDEMGDMLPPIDLGTGLTATAVAAGYHHTCALLNTRKIKCWGHNGQGQLGLGDTTQRGDGPNEMGNNLPVVDLGDGYSATSIACGGSFSCALLENGQIKCWGQNQVGQLGVGHKNQLGDSASEMGNNLAQVNLGDDRSASSIACSAYHCCAVLDNDSIKCWGYNSNGQLGLSDQNPRGDDANEMGNNLPAVNLGGGRSAVGLALGYDYSCAILDDGNVKCWGRGAHGALGRGDNDNHYATDDISNTTVWRCEKCSNLQAGEYYTTPGIPGDSLSCHVARCDPISQKPVSAVFVLSDGSTECEWECEIGYERTGNSLDCQRCGPGFFKDSIFGECLACTTCPENEFESRQCTAEEDRGCRSFVANNGTFTDKTISVEGSSSLMVSGMRYIVERERWEIDIGYRKTEDADVSALYLPKGDASPTTFQTKGFPCGMNAWDPPNEGLAETLCCLQDFLDEYTVTESFRTWADDLDLDPAHGVCNGPVSSDTLLGASVAIGSVFSSEVASIEAVLEGERGWNYATLVIPQDNISSVSRGSASEREMFVGLADFTSTGSRIVDSSAQQIAFRLRRSVYGVFSTFGTVDYSFLTFVSIRTHRVVDPAGLIPDAFYVAVTFRYDEGLVPSSAPVPTDSVVINDNVFPCPATAESLPPDFAASLAQECGPGLDIEDFCVGSVSENDRLGRVYIPLDIATATDASGFVNIDLSVVMMDGDKEVSSMLSLAVWTADDRFVKWCGEVQSSTVAEVSASLYLGVTGSGLEDVEHYTASNLSNALSDARSIEEGLCTLVLEIPSDSEGAAETEVYIEDMVTIHVTPGSPLDMASIQELYLPHFDFAINPDTGLGSIVIPPGLLTDCPLAPNQLYGCATRQDVSARTPGSTALEIKSGEEGAAADFMALVFRDDGPGARDLGTAFHGLLVADGIGTGQHKKGFWVLPGYNWKGVSGRDVFTLSSEFVIYVLYVLDTPSAGRRRRLMSTAAGSGTSKAQASIKYSVDVESFTASVLGTKSDFVSRWIIGMSLEPAEVCLPTAELLLRVKESFLSSVTDCQCSSAVRDVHILSINVEKGGVSCDTSRAENARRTSSPAILFEAVVIFEEEESSQGAPSLDTKRLVQLPGMLSLELIPEKTSVITTSERKDTLNAPAHLEDDVKEAEGSGGGSAFGLPATIGVVAGGVAAVLLVAAAWGMSRRSRGPPPVLLGAMVEGTSSEGYLSKAEMAKVMDERMMFKDVEEEQPARAESMALWRASHARAESMA